MPRKALSKSLRFDILKRDRYTCQYCGAHAPDVELEIDHVNPVAKDGKNNPENLITACRPCNRGKQAKPANFPQAFPSPADWDPEPIWEFKPPMVIRSHPRYHEIQQAVSVAQWPALWNAMDSAADRITSIGSHFDDDVLTPEGTF